jgi:hypothetical protein
MNKLLHYTTIILYSVRLLGAAAAEAAAVALGWGFRPCCRALTPRMDSVATLLLLTLG